MIYISADHAGFELKMHLIDFLRKTGQAVEDCGALEFNSQDDYPDFIYPCAVKVGQNPGSVGIVIGGSGTGEAMVANKAKGVRSALFYGGHEEIVKLSRQHNNCNVLSLGARFLTKEEAERAINIFIETGFDGGRHENRIAKINKIENN